MKCSERGITRQQAAEQFADVLSDQLDIGEAAKAVLPNAINDIRIIHTYDEVEYRHRFGIKIALLGPKKQELPPAEHWHEVSASIFHKQDDFGYVLDQLLKNTIHELVRSDTTTKLVLLYADEIEVMQREIDDKDRMFGRTFVPEVWSDEIIKSFCSNLVLKQMAIPKPGAVVSTWGDPETANRDRNITKHALDQVRIKRPPR